MPSLGATAIRFFFQRPLLGTTVIRFFSKAVVQVCGFCPIHLPPFPTTTLHNIFVNNLYSKLI